MIQIDISMPKGCWSCPYYKTYYKSGRAETVCGAKSQKGKKLIMHGILDMQDKNGVLLRRLRVMRLIDADRLCEDLLNRWSIADARKEELIRQVMADVVTPIVVSQPTVEPQLKWILCSKKMPEEHEWVGTKKFGTTRSDEVHVTFESPNGDRFVKTLSFQNGELSAFEQRVMDNWHRGSKPIAWMNFPEPYKQKEQE